MKLYNKFLGAAAILSLGLVAYSCDDDNNSYTPGDLPDGEQVYIPQSQTGNYTAPEDQLYDFELTVMRSKTDDAVSVPVTVTPQGDDVIVSAFTFPATVNFAAGSNTATYTFQCDATGLEYDEQQQFLFSIADEHTTPYGVSEIILTINKPAPWTLLGTGDYYDVYWGVADGEDDEPIDVTVWQNDLDPNLFRVQNPYRLWNGEDTFFEFYITVPGDTYFGQVVDVRGLVVYNDYYFTYNPNYDDDIYLVFPGRFTNYADPSFWVYNYVVAWQDDEQTLPGEIHISPFYYMFNTGGYNQTTSEPITIIFPGYDPMDLTTEVSYEGMLNGPDGSYNVLASVTLGPDVKSAKVGVGAGRDASVIADAIAEGDLESVTITENTQVKVAFDESNAPGYYTVVVVPYNGDVKGSPSSATFQWAGVGAPAEKWNSLGYVEYVDGYMSSMFLACYPYPEYVELQQSDENKQFYRLVEPYGEAYPYNEPGDWDTSMTSYLNFKVVSNSFAYVLESPQTIFWTPQVGYLTCSSYCAYFIDGQGITEAQLIQAGYGGTVANGVFSFPNYPLDDSGRLSYTELLAGWSGFGEGWYYANYAFDYDAYQETGEEVYITASNGYIWAPFQVDMSNPQASPALAQSLNNRSKNIINKFAFKPYLAQKADMKAKAKALKPATGAAGKKAKMSKSPVGASLIADKVKKVNK